MHGDQNQGSDPRTRGGRWGAWLRRCLVVGLVGVVAFGGGVAFAEDYLRPADPANPISIRGCVIRFDTLSSTGKSVVPRIHANSTHMCVGVTSVKADWAGNGDLIVTNTGGPGVVVSLAVSPDETLVRKGISCGGSGGTYTTTVICYDRAGNHVPAYSLKMYGSTSNLWLNWTMWHK
ncbi:MAG: hypothetical protein ACRDT6_04195 [Micromonosporaceae bacterium]